MEELPYDTSLDVYDYEDDSRIDKDKEIYVNKEEKCSCDGARDCFNVFGSCVEIKD